MGATGVAGPTGAIGPTGPTGATGATGAAAAGEFESSFGNSIQLESGGGTVLGINLKVGLAANNVDARRLVNSHLFSKISVSLGSVLPPGVSILFTLLSSTDNGANYLIEGLATVPSGSRSVTVSFGPVILPADSQHCIGVLVTGGSYTGPVSISIG